MSWMSHKERFDKAFEFYKGEFPKLSVVEKRTSVFMWIIYIISFMWIWNRRFFKFKTAILYTIYVSDVDEYGLEYYDLPNLEHEVEHIRDYKEYGILFILGYLFPQVLAVFAILAVWNMWFILFLVALAPWPAPFRVMFEINGYEATFTRYIKDGVFERWGEEEALKFLKKVFCSSSYFFMSWRWSSIERHFRNFFYRKING